MDETIEEYTSSKALWTTHGDSDARYSEALPEKNPGYKSELQGGAMGTPISGIVGSLCVAMFLDTVFIHLATVSFNKDASTIATLQLEAVVRPNVIVDALMVASGIATCGTIP